MDSLTSAALRERPLSVRYAQVSPKKGEGANAPSPVRTPRRAARRYAGLFTL